MQKIVNFTEARRILSAYIPPTQHVGNYTLERMLKLMEFLGNPQNSLKVVHVAGTSGKTSTCYYIAALLQKAGAKTGLTISPNVGEINNRILVDASPLPEPEFCNYLSEFLRLVEASRLKPTYFEVLAAFAFWLFNKKNVNYAVVEVGLGGLLDGTNVVNRPDKVCVITDIGLDHQEILGNTLTEIAFQKAGIIKNNNPVFMQNQNTEIIKVVKKVVREKQAELHLISLKSLPIEAPAFQKRNWSLAANTTDFIFKRDKIFPLNPSQQISVLNIRIPARLEIVEYKNRTIILDGAHNRQKITALVEGIQTLFPDKSVTILASFGQNKTSEVSQSLELLRQISDDLIVTAFIKGQDEPRFAIEPKRLADYCQKAGFENAKVEEDPGMAFQKLLDSDAEILLVTGSFYLLNQIRPLTA